MPATCSDQTPPQQVERGLRGTPAYELTVAGQEQFTMLCVCVVRERDIDETDGFVVRIARRAGDACDGETEICLSTFAHAFRHRLGHRRADRAVLANEIRRYTKQTHLRLVRVGHHALSEVVR